MKNFFVDKAGWIRPIGALVIIIATLIGIAIALPPFFFVFQKWCHYWNV